MTIGEELAAFRAGCPSCTVVAFADLSTGMVLAANTAEKTTQEKLDALCEAARLCLSEPGLQDFGESNAAGNGVFPSMAWQADASGVRCYVRAAAPATEALCCVVATDAPLADVSADAAALLARIVAEA